MRDGKLLSVLIGQDVTSVHHDGQLPRIVVPLDFQRSIVAAEERDDQQWGAKGIHDSTPINLVATWLPFASLLDPTHGCNGDRAGVSA